MKRIASVALLFSGAVFGGALVVGVGGRFEAPLVAQQTPTTARDLSAPRDAVRSDLIQIGSRFEMVARQVSPAVVYVEATKPATPNGASRTRPVEESGSGVIIRAEGWSGYLVLSNNHVIAHAPPEQITVSLADGRLFHPSRVWADPESDVAVLRLDSVEDLPTATLGDSDRARVGQWVLAIGSPFGLNQTVTHGIVSARERGQISLGSTIRIKDFLQTDAAINPGSSGGPLVNLDGQVIGINTAIASHNGNNSGVAFSIPINLVKQVMRQLLERGTVARGYLGMQLAQAFEPADALRLGLDRVQGALVEVVYPETPAAAAGLQPDDVVLQIDGVVVRHENHLINSVSGLTPGRKVQLQVWRARKLHTLEAVVGDWSRAQARFHAGE
jgi:S1-C subfamily serine protease